MQQSGPVWEPTWDVSSHAGWYRPACRLQLCRNWSLCHTGKRVGESEMSQVSVRGSVFNRVRQNCVRQNADVIHQVPDMLVRFKIGNSGHSGKSDPVFHNPEELLVRICL